MSLPQIFESQTGDMVRGLVDAGESVLVAKDLCRSLSLDNVGMACESIPDEWKRKCQVQTPGGKQEMLCLTQSGAYRLLMRSNKPEAVALQNWVCGEVLPALAKGGSYSVDGSHEETIPAGDAMAAIRELVASNAKLVAMLSDRPLTPPVAHQSLDSLPRGNRVPVRKPNDLRTLLLTKLRHEPGQEINHIVLLRRMKISARDFYELIGGLEAAGKIEVKGGGTGLNTFYRLAIQQPTFPQMQTA